MCTIYLIIIIIIAYVPVANLALPRFVPTHRSPGGPDEIYIKRCRSCHLESLRRKAPGQHAAKGGQAAAKQQAAGSVLRLRVRGLMSGPCSKGLIPRSSVPRKQVC